jgi:hypothetical protein
MRNNTETLAEIPPGRRREAMVRPSSATDSPMWARSVPFPLYIKRGTGTVLSSGRRSVGTSPTRGRALEAAGSFERLQSLTQAFVLDPERVAELGSGEDRTQERLGAEELPEESGCAGRKLPLPLL